MKFNIYRKFRTQKLAFKMSISSQYFKYLNTKNFLEFFFKVGKKKTMIAFLNIKTFYSNNIDKEHIFISFFFSKKIMFYKNYNSGVQRSFFPKFNQNLAL